MKFKISFLLRSLIPCYYFLNCNGMKIPKRHTQYDFNFLLLTQNIIGSQKDSVRYHFHKATLLSLNTF